MLQIHRLGACGQYFRFTGNSGGILSGMPSSGTSTAQKACFWDASACSSLTQSAILGPQRDELEQDHGQWGRRKAAVGCR